MSPQTHLRAEFVEFIPDQLELGKLYISRRYATASHLCCCGCGLEVVTPLKPAKWHLTESNGTVSLHPSIGNWSFPCQSHYWIIEGRVQWASVWSPERIAATKERDLQDAKNYGQRMSASDTVRTLMVDLWAKLSNQIRQWLRR